MAYIPGLELTIPGIFVGTRRGASPDENVKSVVQKWKDSCAATTNT